MGRAKRACEPVDAEIARRWAAHIRNMNKLQDIELPRLTIDLDNVQSAEINICCDGSLVAFAFAMYIDSAVNEKPNLIFAKSKVVSKRSVPQTELLAVYLALKSLPLVLKPYKEKVTKIYIWCDAQVALEWIE